MKSTVFQFALFLVVGFAQASYLRDTWARLRHRSQRAPNSHLSSSSQLSNQHHSDHYVSANEDEKNGFRYWSDLPQSVQYQVAETLNPQDLTHFSQTTKTSAQLAHPIAKQWRTQFNLLSDGLSGDARQLVPFFFRKSTFDVIRGVSLKRLEALVEICEAIREKKIRTAFKPDIELFVTSHVPDLVSINTEMSDGDSFSAEMFETSIRKLSPDCIRLRNLELRMWSKAHSYLHAFEKLFENVKSFGVIYFARENDDEGLQDIIKKMTKLETLVIFGHNRLSLPFISEAIESKRHLVSLYISKATNEEDEDDQEETLSDLSKTCSRNKNLKRVVLEKCGLGDETLAEFVESISDHPSLEKLDLSGNDAREKTRVAIEQDETHRLNIILN